MRLRDVVAGIGGVLLALSGCSGPDLPAPEPVSRVVQLDQGWPDEVRWRYRYTPQGTLMVPLAWLKHIERGFFDSSKLMDPQVVNGLRFMTDGVKPGPWNKDGLPIGWAVSEWASPDGQSPKMQKVGFTCATCHTGQINYRGTAMIVDGAGALQDSGSFQTMLGTSILATYAVPWKRARFLDAVTAENGLPRAANEEMLSQAFDQASSGAWQQFTKTLYDKEGYGRLDALQRIANTLLADDAHATQNNRRGDAPVKFPYLWDIWRFDWVQYNASVRQPMARNLGEALGVRAETNFVRADGSPVPEPDRWKTSAEFGGLEWMEATLRQLRPPRWPADILGPIEPAKAARGQALFSERCAGCHGIKVDRSRTPEEWRITQVKLSQIGTSPGQATNFVERRYDGTPVGLSPEIDGATALRAVTGAVTKAYYDENNYSPEQRAAADGFGRSDEVIAAAVYKARPLVGIWATPPFLHNGSVPTLFDLLSPERPVVFHTGTREYDPVKVGYETAAFPGSQRFDAEVKGNENTGHWFIDDARPGRIGPALPEADRWALIEYLKSATHRDYPCRDAVTGEALRGAVCNDGG